MPINQKPAKLRLQSADKGCAARLGEICTFLRLWKSSITQYGGISAVSAMVTYIDGVPSPKDCENSKSAPFPVP